MLESRAFLTNFHPEAIIRRMVRWLVIVMFVALPSMAAPALSFRSDGIDITSLTPGATIVLFGVQQEADRDHLKVRTFEESLTDDDRDGAIAFDAIVNDRSLWAVGEIGGEGITTASPGDFKLTPLPGSALRSPNSISLRADLLEVLYFRPEVGAWRTTIVDSGKKDADREPDGKGTIAFDQLDPMGNAPASPEHYAPGDVLIAIDPLELTGYILGAGK